MVDPMTKAPIREEDQVKAREVVARINNRGSTGEQPRDTIAQALADQRRQTAMEIAEWHDEMAKVFKRLAREATGDARNYEECETFHVLSAQEIRSRYSPSTSEDLSTNVSAEGKRHA